jgi:hypothetical protein
VRIVSDAYLTTEAGLPPHRPVSALQGLCDGVICLSGGPGWNSSWASSSRWVPRLLPDRRRLHQMGQGARHPGRAGPRLGRRLAGRLCADHHRPRPAALGAAVRALPQPRTRVDARLRHRLLPGPPRRGDPLRAGEIRPRQGRADHHLRRAAGPPCATWAACCRCPTARSTGCPR